MGKLTWHKVADNINELPFNSCSLLSMQVNGKKITLARIDDAVAACAYKCPHAGGIMEEGFLDAAGNIVCPLHRYKFSLKNGRNLSGEGYYLKTYPVDVRQDGIFIGLEDKGLFSWS